MIHLGKAKIIGRPVIGQPCRYHYNTKAPPVPASFPPDCPRGAGNEGFPGRRGVFILSNTRFSTFSKIL